MPSFTDQTGRTITLDKTPQRIISLVPSQTELLYSMGLDQEVVGITKFCVHPEEWFRSKTRVGGTKELKPEIIHQLKPDLIIANKEENVKGQVEELAEHYPLWVSDVNDVASAFEMISQVGLLTGRKEESGKLVTAIQTKFSQLPVIGLKRSAAYLIWKDPYMSTGGDTFINAMLEAAGFKNIFFDESRYPELTIDEIQSRKPEFIFLSSEPFPFKQKHVEELQPFFPQTQILLVDGEMFSWYGSRMIKAAGYFHDIRERLGIQI
jgi:ABC-type Fe3+-hydroxamate transport system substrate-binding protein